MRTSVVIEGDSLEGIAQEIAARMEEGKKFPLNKEFSAMFVTLLRELVGTEVTTETLDSHLSPRLTLKVINSLLEKNNTLTEQDAAIFRDGLLTFLHMGLSLFPDISSSAGSSKVDYIYKFDDK